MSGGNDEASRYTHGSFMSKVVFSLAPASFASIVNVAQQYHEIHCRDCPSQVPQFYGYKTKMTQQDYKMALISSYACN